MARVDSAPALQSLFIRDLALKLMKSVNNVKKKKVAERKFSLKDESRRVDLKIHGSGEGCVLCQDTNQLNHRTAFCSQPLL